MSKEVNKNDFIELISEKLSLSKSEATKSLAAVLEGVQEILEKGDRLNLRDFGSFYTVQTKAREGRNPRTGEPLQIDASNAIKFKPASKLKKSCNK